MDATLALMAALRALAEQQTFNDALRQRIAQLDTAAAAADASNAKEVAPDANPAVVQRPE